jgi:hypothetical protein
VTGRLIHQFCPDRVYNPRFKLERSNGYEPYWAPWRGQYRNAGVIDPAIADFRAVRVLRPELTEVPDLLTADDYPIVCEAFRQIVQDLERDTHQFLPVTLHDEAGAMLPGTYWMMNVLQRRDCVIRPEQIKTWEREGHVFPEIGQFWRMHPKARRSITLFVDRSRIEDLHLWRPINPRHPLGQSLYLFEFFVSDELVRRVEEAKLRKMSAQPAVLLTVPSDL